MGHIPEPHARCTFEFDCCLLLLLGHQTTEGPVGVMWVGTKTGVTGRVLVMWSDVLLWQEILHLNC